MFSPKGVHMCSVPHLQAVCSLQKLPLLQPGYSLRCQQYANNQHFSRDRGIHSWQALDAAWLHALLKSGHLRAAVRTRLAQCWGGRPTHPLHPRPAA